MAAVVIRGVAITAGLVVLSLPVAMLGAGQSSTALPGAFDQTRLEGHIPQPMRSAYLDAAAQWDIDWALLAAIGKLECDHGRYQAPGCWPPGTINHAGARGPMQFLGSTWRHSADRYDPDVAGPPVDDGQGYATDGNGNGLADPWSPYDAVHAAARYLVDLGGRDDPRQAAQHYNAGPNHPDLTAGADYAARATELIAEYHALAGHSGPGSPNLDVPGVDAFDEPGGCSIPDPTGTGGCVTPRTANLVARLKEAFGQLSMWCWAARPANPTSDHPRGRACDITVGEIGRFPTDAERDRGWMITNWLVANAEPLGITYLIFDGRLWSPDIGWRAYTGGGIYNPGHPTGGHFDHIHASVRR